MLSPTIDDARKFADIFRNCLPRSVEARRFTLESKNPFKAMVLRESLIHRVSMLTDGAVSEFDAERWISATVLVRATAEPTAMLHSLGRKVDHALHVRDDGGLTEFLRRSMVASRSEPDLPEAINVLTLINKVDKDFPGFRKSYDHLSEYAHPNWCGVLGAYSHLDRESHTVTFGARETRHNVAALMAILTVAQHVYNDVGSKIAKLSEAFDRGDLRYPTDAK